MPWVQRRLTRCGLPLLATTVCWEWRRKEYRRRRVADVVSDIGGPGWQGLLAPFVKTTYRKQRD